MQCRFYPEYSIDKTLPVLFSLVLTLVLFNIKRSSMLQVSALNFLFITNDWCHRLCCDLHVDRKKLLRNRALSWFTMRCFNVYMWYMLYGDILFLSEFQWEGGVDEYFDGLGLQRLECFPNRALCILYLCVPQCNNGQRWKFGVAYFVPRGPVRIEL